MRIEHSKLKSEFVSLWFETKVEGILKYETVLDVTRCEWHTGRPDENQVLLRGKFDAHLPEDSLIEYISSFIESAIQDGRI